MRVLLRRPFPSPFAAAALLAALAAVCAGCAGPAVPSATTVPTVARSAAPSPAATDPVTPRPDPTEVPGGTTPTPELLPSGAGTTETAWGTILDAVPGSFPVLPGAEPAEALDEPVSAAWLAPVPVEEAAAWYRGALVDQGYGTVDLGSPLEDGSRVLDVSADIPECRLQVTFRPQGESTIITVLYAAACAGVEG